MKECKSHLIAGTWLMLLLSFAVWLPSGAATFPVTNLNDSGPFSLRDAITQANANPTNFNNPHVIEIQVSGTLVLQSLLPTVFNYTDIQGPSSGTFTLDGNVQFQVLKIADPNTLGNLKVSLTNLKITNGLGSGGGLFIENSTVFIDKCQISQNLGSQNTGAGILINTNANVTMTNSVVNNNINSAGIGGGLAISGTGSTLTVTNCTFTNNVSGVGGAIDVIAPASVTINSSTIANNISQGNGGGIYLNAGFITINNSLIANNNAQIISNIGNDIRVNPDSSQNRILSTQGSNLLTDATGFSYAATAVTTGNIIATPGADIVNAALADNGGPTPTLALTPCSRAIDAGSSLAPATDQRGNARVNTPDIGAYEYDALLVTNQQNCGPATIVLNVSGGTSGPSAYNWFDAPTGGTQLAQNTASLTLTNQAVTDTFFVAEAASCASPKRYPVIVTIFPVPQVPIISTNGLPTNVCSGGNINLTATSATQPVNFEWFLGTSSVGTGSTLNASAAGNYTVTVTTDATQGACTSTSLPTTVNFLPPPQVPVVQSSLVGTPCDGDTVLLSTSAVENFYQWNLNGNPIPAATNDSLRVIAAGQYTLTVSSTVNCSTTSAAVAVSFNPLPVAPVITPSGPIVFCSGNDVTLSSSYATGNSWSLSSTPSVSLSSNQTFVVTQSGRYRVTHTDANGCKAFADTTVTVNVASVPVITANGPVTFCDGDSVRITSTNAQSFAWLFNNLPAGLTSSSIRVTTTQNVSVVTTDNNGCSDTSNVITVTANPIITPVITPSGPTTLCQGGSVTLTSNIPTGNVWSNGQTGSSINVTSSGTFIVAIPGCSLPSLPLTVTVNQNPQAPVISPGDTSYCFGNTVVFTASPSTGNLLWNDASGTTGNALSVSAVGNYVLTVTTTDANGCSTTSDPVVAIVFPVPSAPVIIAGGPTTFCQGGVVTLSANQLSGVSWFEAGSPVSFDNSSQVIVQNSGNYFITYQDVNNCLSGQSNTIAVTVNVPVQPVINASGPLTFCAGTSVDLSFAPAGVSNTWSLGNQTGATINVNSTQSGITVTTVDANNCTSVSAPVDVVVNPIITPTISSAGGPAFCTGDSLVLSSSSSSGNTWSLNGTPLASTGQNITVNTPGDYLVQITGCSSPSAPFTVTQNPIPSQPVVTSPDNFSACDGSTVTLRTNASAGLYQWNVNGSGNADSVLVNTAGAYHVTVFNQFGCQNTSADVQVTFTPLPANPLIVSSAGNTICAGANTTLSASNYSSNLTWTLPDNSTVNNPTINATQPGVYSVVFTDQVTGCNSLPSLFNLQVLASLQPQIVVLGQTTFCQGDSVVLTSNLTSSFLWQGTPAPANPTAGSITINQSGTYTLLNTLCNQTSAPVTVTVNANPPVPVLSPGQDTTICQGTNIQISSSAPSGNTWNNNATNQSITVNSGGSFFVTVTNSDGCTAQSSPVNVTIQNPPQVGLPDSINICGNSVVLNAGNPGASYVWSGTGTTAADTLSQFTAVSSGFYLVSVTNQCGTVTSDTSFVTLRPVPVVSLNDTSTCAANVVLDAGNAGSNYLWSNGQTVQQIVAQTSGIYSVQVTNPQGCSITRSITVTINNGLPVVNLGSNHTQCGGSYTLNAGNTGALNYLWTGPGVTPADTIQTLVVSQSGTYVATVTNACGTATSAPVIVTINAIPTLELGNPLAQCGGTLTLVSPVPASAYVWTGPGIVGPANEDSVTINASGNYTLTITDANNCSATDTKVVNLQSSLPQVTLDSLVTTCADSVQLDAGNPGSQYLWSGPGITAADTNQTVYVSNSGAYFVTVANGCGFTVSNPSNIQFVNPSSVDLGNDVQQCGGTYVINSGISGAASYAWTRNGQPFGGNTPSITVSQNGNYAVVVTIQQGCTSTDAVIVILDANLPVVNLGGPYDTCATSISLDAGGPGNTYAWSNGSGPLPDTTSSLLVTQSGTYLAAVTNGCGTTTSAPAVVSLNPIPSVQINNASACNASVLLDAGNPGASYTWSGAGTTAADTNQVLSVITAGSNTYTVVVTNVFGCSATDNAQVLINTALPVVNLVSDTVSCQAAVTVDAGSDGVTYSWSDNGPSTPVRTFNQTGQYIVSVSNACGVTSDTTNITIGQPFTVNINNGTDTIRGCTNAGNNILLFAGNFAAGSTFIWSGQLAAPSNTATAIVNTGGNYSVTVTQNGCTATDNIVVIPSTTPPAAVTLNDAVQCGGTVTLNAGPGDANTTYAWTGAVGLPASQSVSVGSGTYAVTVTNGCGSITSNNAVITINPDPIVNLGNDTSACGGSITLTAGTFPVGTTYQWSGPGIVGPNNTASVTVNQSGSYSVTVTNTSNCTGTDQINVNLATNAPVVNLGGPFTNCADSVLLNAGNAGMSYSWTGPESLANTQTNWVSTNGTYTVVVTNGCGISATGNAVVNLLPVPVVNLGPDTAQCGGTITLFAGNFPGGMTYLWSGPGIVGSNNGSSVNVNASGTYSLVVTNSQGCSASDAINVNINTNTPVVNLGGPFNQCADSILLDAGTPGFIYSWSGPETLANTQTNYVSTSGTYTVTVTNGCGASVSGSAVVTLNPIPVVSLGNDTAQCGGTVTLNAGSFPSGTTYAWTGPGGFSSTNAQVTASLTGNYSVTVTVSPNQGCNASDDINVNLTTTTPVVNLGGPYTGCVDSVLLDAGNPGMTYAWTGPETLTNTQTNWVNTNGSYSVTVTNACGVSASASATLSISVPPVVNLGADTSNCGPVALNAGSLPNHTYAWTGPGGFTASTAAITASQTGSYVVTVTDQTTSCINRDTIVVSISTAPPVVELGGPFSFCSTFTILNAGSFPSNTNFVWSTTNGNINGAVNTNLANVTQSGIYTVTVSNACGSASDNVDITLLTPVNPSIVASGPTTICQGSSVNLTATAGAASYLWVPGGQTTQTIPVSSSGAYACTITAANGCSATSPITQVNVDSPISAPVITAGGPSSFCQGGSVTLTSSSNNNNIWSTNSTSNSITVNLSGTYTVTVTQGACSATSAPFTVTVFPRPFALVSSSGSQTFCKGDSVVLSTGSFASYQWFSIGSPLPDVQIGSAQSQTVKSAGNYYVIVTDANGCTARSFPNTNVVVNDTLPRPVITQTGVISACGGGSITFTSSNAPTYRWSTGATGNSINVTTAGTYYVDVFTNRGCKSTSDTIRLNVTPSAPVDVKLTNKVYPGNHGVSAFAKSDGEIYLDIVGGAQPFTYAWTDSTGNYSSTVEDPVGLRAGLYTVTVTDANGCTGVKSIRLTEALDFKLPEGFSPNGDGKNDKYIIGSIELYPVNKLTIFNRWGNVVYMKENYANEWDGKSDNGNELPDGTYFVVLDIPGLPLSKSYVELRR